MKTFEFSQDGFKQAKEYSRYKEIKNKIEDFKCSPECNLVVVGVLVLIGTLIITPGASTVAYKETLTDSAEIAFKYINIGRF